MGDHKNYRFCFYHRAPVLKKPAFLLVSNEKAGFCDSPDLYIENAHKGTSLFNY